MVPRQFSEEATPYARFGALLREVRQHRHWCDCPPCGFATPAVVTPAVAMPAAPPPAAPPDGLAGEPDNILDVVARLDAAGYHIVASEYRAVEAGTRLPPDPGQFIAAVASGLGLCPHMRAQLIYELACAILRDALGADLAATLLCEFEFRGCVARTDLGNDGTL